MVLTWDDGESPTPPAAPIGPAAAADFAAARRGRPDCSCAPTPAVRQLMHLVEPLEPYLSSFSPVDGAPGAVGRWSLTPRNFHLNRDRLEEGGPIDINLHLRR
jgi:hypothetical protein